jgi:hypothetical protein
VFAGAIGLALLGGLAIQSALVGPSRGSAPAPMPTGPTGGLLPAGSPPLKLSGRLVYAAGRADRPGRQRLVTVDLASGSLVEGARLPPVDAIYAAGPDGRWLVLVGHRRGSGVAFLVRDPAASSAPVEVARGDLISLSPDGRTLIVAETDVGRAPGCPAPAFRLRRIVLATGRDVSAYRGPVPCGTLRSVGQPDARTVAVSVIGPEGLPLAYVLRPDGPRLLYRGYSISARGAFLFGLARLDRLLWPGYGSLRLSVTASRLFGRVVAQSADGRHLAVDGRVGGETGIWLVDVPAGTARLLPPEGSSLVPELSRAAFDDRGRLYAGSPGRILVLTQADLAPLPLPAGSPAPSGPIAWLA